jgi:prepilin peptidase CpaA
MLHGWTSTLGYLLTGIAATILCLAALHDVAARTVPDWMSIVLLAVGFIERILDGRIFAGLLAGIVVFIVSGLCWKRGWLGGGDVKLLGAAAVAMPPMVVAPFAVAVALAGGALSIIYLAVGGALRRFAPRDPAHQVGSLTARIFRIERWRLRRGGPLPYAVAIAAGGLFVLL